MAARPLWAFTPAFMRLWQAGEQAVPDQAELAPQFHELAQFLAQSNTGARAALAVILEKMPSAERSLPELEALENQISNYEFKDATITLDKLADHLGIRLELN